MEGVPTGWEVRGAGTMESESARQFCGPVLAYRLEQPKLALILRPSSITGSIVGVVLSALAFLFKLGGTGFRPPPTEWCKPHRSLTPPGCGRRSAPPHAATDTLQEPPVLRVHSWLGPAK